MGGLGALQKRLLLILNPAAGMRKANRFLVDIIALFNSNGYVCTVFCTARQGHATDIARENAHSFDLVVCIGGDGTMNEVMSGLLDSGVDLPIGYIPAGSTNDFAASLGLSKERPNDWTWGVSMAAGSPMWPALAPLPKPVTAPPKAPKTCWGIWPMCWRA